MPKKILFLVLLVAAFTQCQKKANKIFTPKDLASQFFTINVNKDTVLHTAKGAIIKIPKGSINAGSAESVQLEIKEAYTIADMVQAGLTTRSGKELLSSGGMIYINPADKEKATITKPISISIPTKHQQDGMQLFKGEPKQDGTIDWTAPQPLPKQELSMALQRGKMLFTNNCSSCHNPLKEATGPPLAFLDKRRDKKWLYSFTRNSLALIASGDRLANCVFQHYKATMTAFPDMKDEDIQCIFDYVNYSAGNIAPESVFDFKKGLDSCELYQQKKTDLELRKIELIANNGNRVTKEMKGGSTFIANTVQTAQAPPEPSNLVQPVNYEAVYYQINIETFGWYNIDILLKGLPGFENSKLMVRLIGEYKSEISLFLILPSHKILLDGGLLSGKEDQYGFYTDDGMIPLPQGTPAYILAMSESKGQLYFGITDFKTSLEQSPEIQLSVVTREQMNVEMKRLKFDDTTSLSISVNKTKNADSILKVDMELSEIEKLKPKNCDCNCGASDSSSERIIERK